MPFLPAIPGTGPGLRLLDTASGAAEEVASPGADFTMYVCGITPYDATHLGHAATYVTFDLVNRVMRDAGRTVRYVQNVTDVDDPLFERADRDGVDFRELAAGEVALFRDDMTALAVLPPDAFIGVEESMADIVARIEALLASGAAYPTVRARRARPRRLSRPCAGRGLRAGQRLESRRHAGGVCRPRGRPGPCGQA